MGKAGAVGGPPGQLPGRCREAGIHVANLDWYLILVPHLWSVHFESCLPKNSISLPNPELIPCPSPFLIAPIIWILIMPTFSNLMPVTPHLSIINMFGFPPSSVTRALQISFLQILSPSIPTASRQQRLEDKTRKEQRRPFCLSSRRAQGRQRVLRLARICGCTCPIWRLR